MEKFALVLFNSNNYVMWAAKLMRKSFLYYKVIGIPKEFSAGCGYCVQIKFDETETVKKVLEEGGILYDRIEVMPQ